MVCISLVQLIFVFQPIVSLEMHCWQVVNHNWASDARTPICKYGGVKLAPEVISARLRPDMSTLPNPTHRESLVCVDPADIELISSGGIFTQVKIQIILDSTFPNWLLNKVWSFCFLFIFFLFLFFLYCFYKNKQ